MESERVHLVLVPCPTMGHVVSAVEVAKLLLLHDQRLSITVLILKFHSDTKITAYIESQLSAVTSRINFVSVEAENTTKPKDLISAVEEMKDLVKEAVEQIVGKFRSGDLLAGFVIDMFCTPMIDVANEFGVPSYLFLTSGAAFLALLLSMQTVTAEGKIDTTAFKESAGDLLDLPMFRHPFPENLLPAFALIPEAPLFLKLTRRFRETKGVMVNSFQKLEPYAIDILTADPKAPPVYPVGPVLNIGDHDSREGSEDVIMAWLDDQPPMSVVFLCFGSLGTFEVEQVTELATALERSGQRFLWSLRRPSDSKEGLLGPTEYENLEDVLPEGFLTRMAGIGKVIGWAPQVAVLGHPAVGGFVSHCGWNSVLESLWFGVPLAAWPIYSEQQMNAFEVVVELGLGVEVRMDYRKAWRTEEANMVVKAAEIEKALKELMDEESGVRKKVKEMRQMSREALVDGGSSHSNLARFVQDVITPTLPNTP